jgi:hypothetical protein
MAKIVETVLVVKLSELVRERSDQPDSAKFEELQATLEQVVQELVPTGVVVEVERA